MLLFLSYFLQVSGLGEFGGICYSFSCTNNTISDTSTPCVSVNHTSAEIQFSFCNTLSDLSCNYFESYSLPESSWTDINCSLVTIGSQDCNTVSTQLTGDPCCDNDNCYSGDCLNGLCAGLLVDDTCTVSEQCDPYSYCLNGACTRSKNGGENCSEDNECRPGYGCNFNLCVQIFTLSIGSPSQYAKFCQSNFIVDQVCDILTLQIEGSPYILYNPYLCLVGQSCSYTLSNGTLYDTTNCTCAGYPNLPEGFCGDHLVYVTGVMDVVYPQLTYSTSFCAGVKAHTDDPEVLYKCSSISLARYNYYFNIYNQAMYWNLYITGSLDVCADSYGLWDPFYSYRNFQFAGVLIYTLGIMLVV